MKEGISFSYAGIKSEDMGLLNVSISSGMFEEQFLAPREIKEVKIRGRDKPYFQGIDRQPLVLTLTFAFEDTYDEIKIREVARWLNQDYYQPFFTTDNPNRIFYCILNSEPKLLHNGLKQGYVEIEMRCDSAYSYSPQYMSDIYECKDYTKTITTDTDFAAGVLKNTVVNPSGSIDLANVSSPTFTRATVAYNKNGVQVASGMPRYEFGRFHNLLSANQSNVETDLNGISVYGSVGNILLIRDTTKFASGTASAKATNNSTQNQSVFIGIGFTNTSPYVVYVKPGMLYTFSVKIASDANTLNRKWNLNMEFRDSSNTFITGPTSQSVSVTPDFTRYTLTAFAPTGACYVKLWAVLSNALPGESIWWDEAQLEEGSMATDWRVGGTGYGVFIEEGTTNLILQSENFSSSTWFKSKTTVLTNTISTPFGVSNGGKIIEDTQNGEHYVSQTVNVTSGQSYTISCYVKKGEKTWFDFQTNLTGSWRYVWFDLSNGTVGTVQSGLTNATIKHIGDGWYRCCVTLVAGVGVTNGSVVFQLAFTNGVASYTGDGTSGLYIYGAQVEPKLFATSYMSTTTGSTSRSNEILAISTNRLTPTQGTWEQWSYVNDSSKRLDGNYNRLFVIKNIDGVSVNIVLRHSSTTAEWNFGVADNSGAIVSISVADSITPNGWHLFTVTWNSSAARLYVDGQLVATLENPKLATSFGTAYVGDNNGGASTNTTHDCIRISNVVRTDAEILAYYNLTKNPVADENTVALYNFENSTNPETYGFAEYACESVQGNLKASSVTMSWNSIIPTGTTLKVFTSVNNNGLWTDWAEQTSGSAIAGLNEFVSPTFKYKIEMTSTIGGVVPQLLDITFTVASLILDFENNGDVVCKPEVFITKTGAGDISIVNLSNGGIEFKFTGLADTEQLYVDCENEDIESEIPDVNGGAPTVQYRYSNFNDNYLELSRGLNRFVITGNFTLQLRYKFKTLQG